jgi:hypothetical protein
MVHEAGRTSRSAGTSGSSDSWDSSQSKARRQRTVTMTVVKIALTISRRVHRICRIRCLLPLSKVIIFATSASQQGHNRDSKCMLARLHGELSGRFLARSGNRPQP